MRTNSKIAILKIIRDENALRNSGYFWTSPSYIRDLLSQRYSMSFVRETVLRYLKALVVDGYLTSSLLTRHGYRSALVPDNQNLELTDKAIEFLRLTKFEQKVHS